MVLPCPPLVPLGTSDDFCSVCYSPLETDDDGDRKPECWACRKFRHLDGHVCITYHTRSRQYPIGSWIYFAKAASERKNIPSLGNVLYRWLEQNWPTVRAGWQPTAVTYVPTHPDRVATRGFDLMEEIVNRHPARRDAIGIRPLLRQLDADEQPAEHRVVNPGGWAVIEQVRGERVVVIDDVLTSGATLGSIARMLRSQGAERVFGLTLTRMITYGEAEKRLMELQRGQPFDWDVCLLRASRS